MSAHPASGEAERVVKLLSKAQAAAVLWCNEDGSPREWLKGAETSFYCLAEIIKGDPEKEIATICKLAKRGQGETKKGRYWPCSTWALTPLGLAVRSLLQERNQ